MTRTGLILAVTLILQGLRLVIPIPPQVSMFVVGSWSMPASSWPSSPSAAGPAWSSPPVRPSLPGSKGCCPFSFVFPVALGNSFYVWAAWRWQRYGLPAFCGGALGKAAILYGSFYLLFACIAFPPAVRHMLLFAMSWPQVVTGVIGAVIGREVSRFAASRPE